MGWVSGLYKGCGFRSNHEPLYSTYNNNIECIKAKVVLANTVISRQSIVKQGFQKT